jgi:hypothetical protein
MGFLSGVITGVAVAAGAAAWYMSRSGAKVREQYQFEQRLGEIGDQFEARTKDIQGTVNAQLAEMRSKGQDAADAAESAASTNGHGAGEALDAAQATAAEVQAEAEAMTTKVKKAAKDATD